MRLTNKSIDAIAAPKAGRGRYLDTEVRGLGLLVQAGTGTKTFYWQRKIKDRPKWITLGQYPDLTIETARDAAEQWNQKLGSWKAVGYQGADPFAPRRDVPTLDAVVELYITEWLRPNAKKPEKSEKEFRSVVERRMTAWRTRRLGDISQDDVERMHAKISAKHKRAANVFVKHLRVLYAFALRKKLYQGESPAKGFALNRETKRSRYLLPAELPQLFAALKRAPNPDLRDLVNLSLWTGARKMDVLSMKWQDVDLAGGNVWRIPDPKNRVPYVVPLSTEAVTILKDRHALRLDENPFVFPGRGKSGHLIDLKKRWAELLKDAGLAYVNEPELKLRIHDLRRTIGSFQAAQGTSLSIIGKSLGHVSTAATQIYAQVDLTAVRASVESAGVAIRAAMKKKQTQPRLLPAAPKRARRA